MTDSCLLADYGIVSASDTKNRKETQQGLASFFYCCVLLRFQIFYIVTGAPEYDSLNQIWQSQRVPADLYSIKKEENFGFLGLY